LLGVVVSSDGQHRLMHLTQEPFFTVPEDLVKNKLVAASLALCILFLRLLLFLFVARLLFSLERETRLLPMPFFDDDLLNFYALTFWATALFCKMLFFSGPFDFFNDDLSKALLWSGLVNSAAAGLALAWTFGSGVSSLRHIYLSLFFSWKINRDEFFMWFLTLFQQLRLQYLARQLCATSSSNSLGSFSYMLRALPSKLWFIFDLLMNLLAIMLFLLLDIFEFVVLLFKSMVWRISFAIY